MVREDVAHFALRRNHREVLRDLQGVMRRKGYAPVPVKDDCHLLSNPNWDSPFDPPPRFRCFMVIKEQDGWTTLTDELDLLDEELASELARTSELITVRGYSSSGDYEYRAWKDGHRVPPEQVEAETRELIQALEQNDDHVTRFPYDEVILRREDLIEEAKLFFVGFKRA